MIRKITRLFMGLMVLLPVVSWGQMTLGTSPYIQNFDSLGVSGLPTGWTVVTSATATSLGSPSSVVTDVWANTSGNFRNVAAAESPQTSASSTGVQNAATDRALAIRPSGSFGDPNGAFLFQIANTTGKTGFSLSLKHMTFDDQARMIVYTVEYTTVAAGTSGWTSLGTYTTTTFGSTDATYSFGTALDNISNTVWIRIRGNASTGTGSRDTYGIDDVSLSWNAVAACTGPTNAATAFNTSNLTTTTANLGVTGGNGTSRVTFLKAGTFTTALPSANNTYTANTSFIGTSTAFDGGKTVYNSTANTVSVTDLSPNTVYNAKSFEYLGAAGAECYNTTALTGSFTTLSTAATTTAATSINSNGFTANWSAPTGIGSAAYTYTLEIDTNTAFATPITGSPFTGIASGTTTYTATGLNASTTYYYRVTVVNAAGSSAASNITSITTNAPLPGCAAPNPTGNPVVGIPTASSFTGNFTASTGSADAYVVFVSTNAAAPTLVNGTVYSGNNPSGYTVVQNGTSLTFTASSLIPGTTYYVYVAAYNSNAGCSGGPAYSTITSTTATTAAGVVVPEADGDYRTTSTGNWPGTPAATWQKRISGTWTSAAAPAANYTGGKIIIRHTISTNGNFASPEMAIDNGGTFTVGTSSTANGMHIYDGGTLQVNVALTISSAANFEIEDGGTAVLNYATSGSTALFSGTEIFHPNSSFVISNWATSATTPLLTNMSTNTYNGYTAAFGNLKINMLTDIGSNNIDINPTGTFTKNIAHKNFEFIKGYSGNTVRIATSGVTTSGIGGDFIVASTFGTGFINIKSSGTSVFTIGGNLVLNSGRIRLFPSSTSTSTVSVNNLTMTGTSSLDISGTIAAGIISNLNVSGNISIASTATFQNTNNQSTNQLNLVGTNQTLSILPASTFTDINFNINSNGTVQLLDHLTISNLTLTNGVFDLGTKNLTIVAPSTGNGTVSGGSATAYVQGSMIRNTNSTAVYSFPVGKTGYAPVTIQPSATGSNSFTVNFNKDFKQTPNYTTVSGALTSVNATEWYDISHPTGTATATISLPWGSLSGVTDPSQLVVAHYNSGISAWESLGGTPSGTISSGTVTVTGVSSFSPFAIGAINGAQPLPVKIAAFSIQKQNNKAILSWTLQTTEGNEKVALERSNDGKTFTAINTQAVEEAMTLKQSYTDATPAQGMNQYRLAITGSNGTVMYSNILTASFTKESTVNIYPNPAQQFVQVDWTDRTIPATVEIRSMMGQVMHSQVINGAAHYDMPVGDLGNGIYLITWKQGEAIRHQQIQVLH